MLLDESVESVESESEEKVRETIERDQLRGDENKNSSGETSNKSEEADLRRSSTESESSPRKVVQWEERTQIFSQDCCTSFCNVIIMILIFGSEMKLLSRQP